MVEIKHDDACTAMTRWFEICDPVEETPITCFLMFSGMNRRQYTTHALYSENWYLDEEVAAKIQMLLGVHYKAIIKAWCIKYKIDISVEAS